MKRTNLYTEVAEVITAGMVGTHTLDADALVLHVTPLIPERQHAV